MSDQMRVFIRVIATDITNFGWDDEGCIDCVFECSNGQTQHRTSAYLDLLILQALAAALLDDHVCFVPRRQYGDEVLGLSFALFPIYHDAADHVLYIKSGIVGSQDAYPYQLTLGIYLTVDQKHQLGEQLTEWLGQLSFDEVEREDESLIGGRLNPSCGETTNPAPQIFEWSIPLFQADRAERLQRDPSVIPVGGMCYALLEKGSYRQTRCPYFRYTEYGTLCCDYLGHEEKLERFQASDLPAAISALGSKQRVDMLDISSILWDQLKICQVNLGD